jgi:hypothetical protein
VSLFHRCAGKSVAVSHFEVAKADYDPLSENPKVGTWTRVLYRCSECGKPFVNTYPGMWSLEDFKK